MTDPEVWTFFYGSYINLDVLKAIITKHLDDFTRFTEIVLKTRGFRST